MSLQCDSLHVSVANKEILHGLNLDIKPNEIHAIMGPNGSGKSTLASTIAGHPDFEITQGTITLASTPLPELTPDQRAQMGLFLAFQYPVTISGVSIYNFLREMWEARFQTSVKTRFGSVLEFRSHVQHVADELQVPTSLLERNVNEGFSGGERKRFEILQMALFEPRYAILDETDSGLDVDALRAVADGIRSIQAQYKTGVLIITHYRRILDRIQPNHVHVMMNGRITESGGPELASQLEATGYQNRTE